MIAGKRGVTRLPLPQIATVRMDRPHGRRQPSQPSQYVANPNAAGQPSPNLDRAAEISRRRASEKNQRVVFGLNLAACALVGAAIAIVMWTDQPAPANRDIASLDAVLIDRYEEASRPETMVYRTPPSPEQQAHHVPPAVHPDGEHADAVHPDAEPSPPPGATDRPREVKTVTFTAPIQPSPTVSAAAAASSPAAAPSSAPSSAPGPSLAAVTPDVRVAVSAPADQAPDMKTSDGKTSNIKTSNIKAWRYQLTGVDPQAVAASTADLVVIDYAGSNGPFTRAQVEQMQRRPDGSRRLVLAYMSIGQAEASRWYWAKRSSAWLGAKGQKNYSVRFWHADWQKIVFEYTNKIVTAGFDGVYLDYVDEFEDQGHKDDMVELVARISSKAKAQRADFMVVPQNGDALIANSKFRRAIDGFAREDLLYGENNNGERNAAGKIRETIRRLKTITAEGKPVLVVEYPRSDEQAKTARREISENNFIGLTAKRTLDRL
jgi:cysteinyl-tRNA synthetase